jgi:hypothetical protein
MMNPDDVRAGLLDAIDALDHLRTALEKSVKLQSHYAGLLNMYDGGERLQFASADAWCARLVELAKAEGMESNRERKAEA